jgi:hypothetical protein
MIDGNTGVQIASRSADTCKLFVFSSLIEWDLRGLATNIICSCGGRQPESRSGANPAPINEFLATAWSATYS